MVSKISTRRTDDHVENRRPRWRTVAAVWVATLCGAGAFFALKNGSKNPVLIQSALTDTEFFASSHQEARDPRAIATKLEPVAKTSPRAMVPGTTMETATATRSARQVAQEYRLGRMNLFFNEKQFLQQIVGSELVDELGHELIDVEELKHLPPTTSYRINQPPIVLERMAMIDLLGDLSDRDPRARDELMAVILEPIDSKLPDHLKRLLVGEKSDALTALTKRDQAFGLAVYANVSGDTLKALLRPALIRGLYDAGIMGNELEQYKRRL